MSEGLLWRHGTQGQVMVGVSSLGGCHKPVHTAHTPEGQVASGQKTTREGVQTHPSADNWIKALVSKALPTRTRTSFSHQQSLLPGRLYKPHSLLHERAGRGCKKSITGLVPGLGGSLGGGNGNPLQYFCLENPMDSGD